MQIPFDLPIISSEVAIVPYARNLALNQQASMICRPNRKSLSGLLCLEQGQRLLFKEPACRIAGPDDDRISNLEECRVQSLKAVNQPERGDGYSRRGSAFKQSRLVKERIDKFGLRHGHAHAGG